MARILVIDDHPHIRDLFREALEDHGHIVEVAADGVAGVRCYQQAPVDLVIVDLSMPEQDGLETIRQLRRETPHLPIIAMSGSLATEQPTSHLTLAHHLGATRTFQKPIPLRELLAMVEDVLRPTGTP
jgi:two-component system, chemotaxis family, chemotaxis protein CheY